jgi:diphthine-ammonia ligase
MVVSWSGGKDSCYALLKAMEMGHTPKVLLNVLNEEGKISRSHGIPKAILAQQAAALGLPLQTINSSWQAYEENFIHALIDLKEAYKLRYAVFGDIDLEEHKLWEEKVCEAAKLKALLPLWQQNRRVLVSNMIESGIETMIVSCNNTMGPEFLGKIITESLVEKLEALGVDACGENGEFHTLVINCRQFKQPVGVSVIQKIQHNNYWFAQLSSTAK